MNCDEAFDALTDPAARDKAALHGHLAACPRCREMQAVLAPALALFAGEREPAENCAHEELPAMFSERGRNPFAEEVSSAAKPFLTPEAVQLAEQTAKQLHPSRDKKSRTGSRWVVALALGLLMALGIFFAAGYSSPGTPRHSDPMMLADQCLWKNRTNNRTDPPEPASSRWVVLSCVSCHLESPLE